MQDKNNIIILNSYIISNLTSMRKNILKDIEESSDRFGLVQDNNKKDVTGNGLLYTAEAIAMMLSNGFGKYDKEVVFLLEAMLRCQVEKGLYHRAPEGKDDQEGPDDYKGILLASILLDRPDVAKDIFLYGQKGVKLYSDENEEEDKRKLSSILFKALSLFSGKVKNVWNNNRIGYFTQSAWLGRQINLMFVIKYAAREKTNLFERVLWSSLLAIPCLFRKKQLHDKWILDWVDARSLESASFWSTKIAIKIWKWRFKKVWGGIGEVFEEYFTKHPQHPCATYMKGKI